MKKINKLLGYIVPVTIIVLVLTGCLGLDLFGNSGTITLRTEGNLSTVRAGGTLRFSATGRDLTWTVSSTSDGTGPVSAGTYITSDGVLTVSINETSTILYVIVISANSERSVSKLIRVTTVTGISISPVNPTITRGRNLQFTAQATGSNEPDNAVTWKVSSNASGTGAVTPGTGINSNGVLTVGSNETLTLLYVIAVSVVDPSKSASVPVYIVIPTVTNVTVSPSGQSVTSGRTLQFTAVVVGTNDPNTTVLWTVSSNAAGTGAVTPGTTITSNGLLTVAANETATTLYVFASSVEDPTKSGSVLVTVIIPTVTSVTVSPTGQSATRGRSLQFTALVVGTNNPANNVTWMVSSNAAGTGAVTPGTSINSNGVLTVAANETAPTLYVIANSITDPTKSGSVAVTIIIPTVTGVTVSPSGQTAERGKTLQFTAQVVGTNNPGNAVTWKVSSNAAGSGAVTSGTSINANGLLTISPNETASTLYVFANSAADTTKSGSASVTVIAAAATVTRVTVSPSGQSITKGRTLQFTAQVTGTNNPDSTVTWRVSSNAAGTGAVTSGTSINANGLLAVSANETASTLYVIASSVADTTKSGSASVTVTAAAGTVTGVIVNPSSQTVKRGATIQFTAIVEGYTNPNPPMSWRVGTNPNGTGAVSSGTRISGNGLLTIGPDETATTLYIIATFNPDTSKFGSAIITVTN